MVDISSMEKNAKVIANSAGIILMALGVMMALNAVGDFSNIQMMPLAVGIVLVLVGLVVEYAREHYIKGLTEKKAAEPADDEEEKEDEDIEDAVKASEPEKEAKPKKGKSKKPEEAVKVEEPKKEAPKEEEKPKEEPKKEENKEAPKEEKKADKTELDKMMDEIDQKTVGDKKKGK